PGHVRGTSARLRCIDRTGDDEGEPLAGLDVPVGPDGRAEGELSDGGAPHDLPTACVTHRVRTGRSDAVAAEGRVQIQVVGQEVGEDRVLPVVAVGEVDLDQEADPGAFGEDDRG